MLIVLVSNRQTNVRAWEPSYVNTHIPHNWINIARRSFCVSSKLAAWQAYIICGPFESALLFKNSTFCPHSAFIRFVRISEQTASILLHSTN